jgi:DNA-directed RNA polymerase specialized sigma24 family protein
MLRDFIDLRRRRSHQRNVHVDLTAQEAEKDARLRDRSNDESGKATAMLQDVRRLVERDPKLTEYVVAVELGCLTPAEIADVCQASVKDIYERRRKLRKTVLTHFTGGRRDEEESA